MQSVFNNSINVHYLFAQLIAYVQEWADNGNTASSVHNSVLEWDVLQFAQQHNYTFNDTEHDCIKRNMQRLMQQYED